MGKSSRSASVMSLGLILRSSLNVAIVLFTIVSTDGCFACSSGCACVVSGVICGAGLPFNCCFLPSYAPNAPPVSAPTRPPGTPSVIAVSRTLEGNNTCPHVLPSEYFLLVRLCPVSWENSDTPPDPACAKMSTVLLITFSGSFPSDALRSVVFSSDFAILLSATMPK